MAPASARARRSDAGGLGGDGDLFPGGGVATLAGLRGQLDADGQLHGFAPGFRERILARAARSVAQTEARNPNYVSGDVVTGSNDALQLVFRPRVALDPYSTGVPGVYICSAATPPGAGAHGMCGYNAALSALWSIDPGLDQYDTAYIPLRR